MAYTTINKSSEHFNTKTYVANATDNHAITGVGFRPDFVWLKNQDQAVSYSIYDVVRGAGQELKSDTTATTNVVTDRLKSLDSDGFTLGTSWGNASNGNDYVSWNWKAGQSQGSANNDGSIYTTYTSVNDTAGFSISQFEGTGSVATFGHGLSTKPTFIMIKNVDASQNWLCYHKSIGATKYVRLNLNSAQGTSSSVWNDTEPTNSLVTIGTDGAVNGSSQTMIAYCFSDRQGYMKTGIYTGNGSSTDGAFVYTGFRPSMILLKQTNSSNNWRIIDDKRLGYNDLNYVLYPSANAVQSTEKGANILSNGFKLTGGAGSNGSGSTYVYIAFGQTMVGTNNVPVTAR